MSRHIEIPEKSTVERLPQSRNSSAPRHEERQDLSRERRPITGRTYAYQLSPAELVTLQEIGRFRTVDVADLARFRYQGKGPEMRNDLASLSAQGLLQQRTALADSKSGKQAVVVLTERGKKVLELHAKPGNGQRLYAGFVKPAEVAHDAAIYRMYHAEKEKIERAGGQVRRVVLDYEFKQKIYSPLGKAQHLPAREYAQRQAEIARQNDLKVVRGKIPLPDLRIEYETKDGERAQVDLELATHHYRGSQMRDKAQAGFKMYAQQDSVSHLSAAFDPEFTAEIFSL